MTNNIKILVCAHKYAELPQHEYFYPIHAGKERSNEALPYQPDNTGDNISAKNGNFCELTAHYWAWKNLKHVDIIGLNHYRRYFDFFRPFSAFSPDRSFIGINDFLRKPYIFPDLKELLNDCDIILPNTRNYPYDLTTQYSVFHIVDDWNILKDVIKEITPDYFPAFVKTMDNCNSLSNYNMFITSWKHFDGYSEWLFKILFEVEKRVKLSLYPNQARIFGYMSERLINVYCEKHHLKIKHYPVIMPLDDFKEDYNPTNLQYTMRKIRNNIYYFFMKKAF
ncbi:DUF4422 domain-containing protein [Bacteroides sedimenti]|uniref:Exopolysaccharide biosynthesis protein n=1 Tax=Bacteroides sedimenti TaxID=2136147 RepID=A0ABM8IGY5_9BACE